MKYITALFTFLLAATANACSFAPDADIFKTAQENTVNYEHVIAVTIDDMSRNEQSMETTYNMKLEGVYKGSMHNGVVDMVSPGHSCGFFGSVGQHMLVFTDDLSSIDESNPKYRFDSAAEAVAAGEALVFTSDPAVSQPKPVACTKEYRPVCGIVDEEKTYGNRCVHDADGAKFLYEGPCEVGEKPTTKPQASPTDTTYNRPTAPPEENFVEPTTPPPYDNSPKQVEKTPEPSRFMRWLADSWAWVSGFLTW